MTAPHPFPSPSMRIKLGKSLKGLAWGYKLGRWGRGRRVLCLLIAGVVFCLVIHALIPHPSPAEPHHPLRRIHQEEVDYSGANSQHSIPSVKSAPPAASLGHGLANGVSVTSLASVSNQSAAVLPKGQSASNTAPSRDLHKVFPKLDQNTLLSHRAKLELAKAQETALNAMQFGYRLTAAQKKLMKDLSPQARKQLEDKVAKTRMAQDRIYLSHLRSRHQVAPRPGGGEQIVSASNHTIRFPILLKKTPIAQWPEQYKLYYNLTHYPWVKSRGCENFSISFTPPGSLPPRGLASFPCSGNTWIRYLIEGATGIFTGSMYNDTSLILKGLYGEALVYDSGMTILQKSHGYTTGEGMTTGDKERAQHSHLKELGHRGVVLIRNPFKALISHRHLDVGGHTGFAPKAHFLGEGWADFVQLKIKLWRNFYEDWVRQTSPSDIYVTHYENLRDDPLGEMRGILGYLGITQDPVRLSCLGRNLDGLFKRKPKRNLQLNFNPFTEELRRITYSAIYAVDGALREKGKSGLPLSKYEIYDEEEAKDMSYRTVHDDGDGGGGNSSSRR